MLQEEEASGCKASCMVNLALLEFKAHHFSECFTWCERALKYARVPTLDCFLVLQSGCLVGVAEWESMPGRPWIACLECMLLGQHLTAPGCWLNISFSYQLPAGSSCGNHRTWKRMGAWMMPVTRNGLEPACMAPADAAERAAHSCTDKLAGLHGSVTLCHVLACSWP